MTTYAGEVGYTVTGYAHGATNKSANSAEFATEREATAWAASWAGKFRQHCEGKSLVCHIDYITTTQYEA